MPSGQAFEVYTECAAAISVSRSMHHEVEVDEDKQAEKEHTIDLAEQCLVFLHDPLDVHATLYDSTTSAGYLSNDALLSSALDDSRSLTALFLLENRAIRFERVQFLKAKRVTTSDPRCESPTAAPGR